MPHSALSKRFSILSNNPCIGGEENDRVNENFPEDSLARAASLLFSSRKIGMMRYREDILGRP